MYVGWFGTHARQISIARSRSPIFRYSFASRAKTRRGFSANCFSSSSISADLAIQYPRNASLGRKPVDAGGRTAALTTQHCYLGPSLPARRASTRGGGQREDTSPRRFKSIGSAWLTCFYLIAPSTFS